MSSPNGRMARLYRRRHQANTFSFDPNVVKGGVIEIRFGNDWNVAIDNIGFSQELIPEPASITLLVGGLAGLALRRRNRK